MSTAPLPPDFVTLSAADTRLYLPLLQDAALYWRGERSPSPGPKLLALLAYLHLRGVGSREQVGRERVSREKMAEVFWPNKDRKAGLQSVRQALTQLRKQPGADLWLSEDEHGLSLVAVSEVSEFYRLLALGDDIGALAFAGQGSLLSALPLPSDAFGDWLEDERRSLNEQRLQVLQSGANRQRVAGDFDTARSFLAQALALEPDNEATYRALMELEYKAGNAQKAREVFEQCRQMLLTELELPPSPETLALLAQIDEQHKAPSNQRGWLLSQVAALPQSEEPLYGREVVRRKLLDLLTPGARALLHGLGGLGKTRLASAVAAHFLQAGQKVIWLEVGANTADTVLSDLNDLLRVRSQDTLAQAFAQQNVGLIVLDNVASSYAAQQVQAFLPAAPVLVTSRLRLPGIKALELTPLERESALQLLQYHLGEEHAASSGIHAINQEALCVLLGDHPFALRLAAPTLIRGGSSVMQALYAAPHDTIRTLLDQSLQDVSPREYEVFLALGSLYAPQATPELLSFVLGRPLPEVEDALWELSNRSLLNKESRAGSDTLCFRMHDLTWYAAREHQAHLPHHLVAAVTEYAQVNTHNPDLLGTDLPHLLGAAEHAPIATLTQLMAGWLGGSYIGARGFPSGALHLLERATQHAAEAKDWNTASLLLGKQADIAQALLGNQAEAITKLLQAAEYAGVAGNAARQAVQLALAGQMEAAGGWPQAWEHLRAAQALAQAEDILTQARVLGQVAMAHAYRKEFEQAHALLSQARDILQPELATAPSKVMLMVYLDIVGNLGQAEKRLGNLERALSLKQEVGALAAEKDIRLYQARAALDQGELLNDLGRHTQALMQLEQAIQISQSIGAGSLESMARRLHQDISSALK